MNSSAVPFDFKNYAIIFDLNFHEKWFVPPGSLEDNPKKHNVFIDSVMPRPEMLYNYFIKALHVSDNEDIMMHMQRDRLNIYTYNNLISDDYRKFKNELFDAIGEKTGKTTDDKVICNNETTPYYLKELEIAIRPITCDLRHRLLSCYKYNAEEIQQGLKRNKEYTTYRRRIGKEYLKRKIAIHTLIGMLEEYDKYVKDVRQEPLDEEISNLISLQKNQQYPLKIIQENINFLKNNRSVKQFLVIKLIAALKAYFGCDSSMNQKAKLDLTFMIKSDDKLLRKLDIIPKIVLTEQAYVEYNMRLTEKLAKMKQNIPIELEERPTNVVLLYAREELMSSEDSSSDVDNEESFNIYLAEYYFTYDELYRIEYLEVFFNDEMISQHMLHSDESNYYRKFERQSPIKYNTFIEVISFIDTFINRYWQLKTLVSLLQRKTKDLKIYQRLMNAIIVIMQGCDVYSPIVVKASFFFATIFDIRSKRYFFLQSKLREHYNLVKLMSYLNEIFNETAVMEMKQELIEDLKFFRAMCNYNPFYTEYLEQYLKHDDYESDLKRYTKCLEDTINGYDLYMQSLKEKTIRRILSGYVMIKMMETREHIKEPCAEVMMRETSRLQPREPLYMMKFFFLVNPERIKNTMLHEIMVRERFTNGYECSYNAFHLLIRDILLSTDLLNYIHPTHRNEWKQYNEIMFTEEGRFEHQRRLTNLLNNFEHTKTSIARLVDNECEVLEKQLMESIADEQCILL